MAHGVDTQEEQPSNARSRTNPLVVAAIIAAVGGIIVAIIPNHPLDYIAKLFQSHPSPVTDTISFNKGEPLAEFVIKDIQKSDPNHYQVSFSGYWKHIVLGCQNETGGIVQAGSTKSSLLIHIKTIPLENDVPPFEADYQGTPIQIPSNGVRVICFPIDRVSGANRADMRIPSDDMGSCPGEKPMTVTCSVVN